MSMRTRLQELLANPFAGFAPWIVMSVIEGPQRFELAAGLAFALALVAGGLGALLGERPKLLDVAGIVFFAALVVAGLLVDEQGLRWLERWSGEISNAVIALIAIFSIAVRMPFTIQYSRETVPREHWSSPQFLRLNYTITWVWTAAFLVTAIVGFLGDGPLDQPDNLWTNWIVQIAALILALRFTEWYPQVTLAREEIAAGTRADPPPSLRELVLPVVGYIVPVGIVVLAVGGAPWWVGAGMIVLGAAVSHRLTGEEAAEQPDHAAAR
jgi:SNF family Na+-dependent transporter